MWLAVSWGFSQYVENFASYNETYGSLGGVVVLLMWFYLGGVSRSCSARRSTPRSSCRQASTPPWAHRGRAANAAP